MATYIIGDIQGCADSLIALLKRCMFSDRDQLWCVGDLVNRGPQSLEVIDFLMGLNGQAKVVLGNHDLHLLACHAGAKASRGDTIEAILSSPKREEMIAWLRAQPILHEELGQAMIHAGINPQWTWSEVRDKAQHIHERLMCDEGLKELARHHPSKANPAHPSSAPPPWIEDLAWFTRVRFIQDGEVDEYTKGGPTEGQVNSLPWYQLYEESLTHKQRPQRLFVGHWAALGLRVTPRLVSLDTGCIWGRYLTAMRLEDDALFMQSTIEPALTPKNQRSSSKKP